MSIKTDQPLSINHRLGRIVLHTVATKNSVLRVRRLLDGSLETFGRVYGAPWSKDGVRVHDNFLEAVQRHLNLIGSFEYYYIELDNLTVVNRRFERLKAGIS